MAWILLIVVVLVFVVPFGLLFDLTIWGLKWLGITVVVGAFYALLLL